MGAQKLEALETALNGVSTRRLCVAFRWIVLRVTSRPGVVPSVSVVRAACRSFVAFGVNG